MARWVGVVIVVCACSNAQTAATPDRSDAGAVGDTVDAGTDADAGTGAAATDAGSAAQTNPQSLDPTAVGIWDVSPDGTAVLASHAQNDLVLVRRGAEPQPIALNVARAEFSPDGNLFTWFDTQAHFATVATGTAPEGVVTSPNGVVAFAGRWVYWTAQSDGEWHVYRTPTALDGSIEILRSGVAPAPSFPDVSFAAAPKGDAYATSVNDAWQLVLPGVKDPLALQESVDLTPTREPLRVGFSSDGKVAATNACTAYDAAGNLHRICAAPPLHCSPQVPRFSDDGSHLVTEFDDPTHVVDLTTWMASTLQPLPAQFPGCNVFYELTPDASHVIGQSSKTSFDGPPTSAYIAPSSGGEWTLLASDICPSNAATESGVAVSPDSRIIATNSLSAGTIVSVDGAAPTVLMTPMPAFPGTPHFEPAGGRDRVIFWVDADPIRAIVTDREAKGPWAAVTDTDSYPRWEGHNIWLPVRHPQPDGSVIYSIDVITDAAQRLTVLSGVGFGFRHIEQQGVTTGFYIVPGQGLFSKVVPEAAP
jgi:hypothetical protein